MRSYRQKFTVECRNVDFYLILPAAATYWAGLAWLKPVQKRIQFNISFQLKFNFGLGGRPFRGRRFMGRRSSFSKSSFSRHLHNNSNHAPLITIDWAWKTHSSQKDNPVPPTPPLLLPAQDSFLFLSWKRLRTRFTGKFVWKFVSLFQLTVPSPRCVAPCAVT